MKSERKIRFALFMGSLAILIIVFTFLWIIDINQNDAAKETFVQYISILGLLSVVSLAAFFAFAQVFDENGRIYTSHITTMLVTLLMIVQLSLAFSTYTSKSMAVAFDAFENAHNVVSKLDNASSDGEITSILEDATTNQYDFMAVVDDDGTVKYASKPELVGTALQSPATMSFILYSNDNLAVQTSGDYHRSVTSELILSQLTLLIVSLLFSVEFVMFIVGRVSLLQRTDDPATKKLPAVLTNVRQIAFLFYFASRLSASFIPIMAKRLPTGALSLDGNMIAALPQTAETLLTCIAILFTSRVLTKRGWKPSFMLGLGLVILGTLMSAFSPTLVLFTMSRALVGLGYGFCWMTLRSVALLAEDDESRVRGFSILNSGLYAGMFCGSTVGSIIAVSFGYSTVLVISSALICFCGLFIMTMKNQRLAKSTPDKDDAPTEKIPIGWRQVVNLMAFLMLLIAPSCIAGAYSEYFLPLYYEEIGRTTLDVGRAQLIYGLVIVYIGPFLTVLLARKKRSLILTNALYNVLLAGGLILLGLWGGFAASLVAITVIAVGDCFGFGMQNNYFLGLSISKRLGSSRSLTYLSLSKKLMEMLGPTLFAVSMSVSSTKGVLTMGIVFALAVALYFIIRFIISFRATRGLE